MRAGPERPQLGGAVQLTDAQIDALAAELKLKLA